MPPAVTRPGRLRTNGRGEPGEGVCDPSGGGLDEPPRSAGDELPDIVRLQGCIPLLTCAGPSSSQNDRQARILVQIGLDARSILPYGIRGNGCGGSGNAAVQKVSLRFCSFPSYQRPGLRAILRNPVDLQRVVSCFSRLASRSCFNWYRWEELSTSTLSVPRWKDSRAQ